MEVNSGEFIFGQFWAGMFLQKNAPPSFVEEGEFFVDSLDTHWNEMKRKMAPFQINPGLFKQIFNSHWPTSLG